MSFTPPSPLPSLADARARRSFDLLVTYSYSFEGALASFADLSGDDFGLGPVRKTQGYPLPFRADPPPATFNRRPTEQVGLDPEMVGTGNIA